MKLVKRITLVLQLVAIVFLWIPLGTHEFWANVSKTIILLATFTVGLYNEISTFYIKINRIRMFIKNDTVSWEQTYKFYTEMSSLEAKREVSDFSKLKRFKRINEKENSTELDFDINGHKRTVEIFYKEEEDHLQIKFKYSASVAYRDCKFEFKQFESLLTELLKRFKEVQVEHKQSFYSLSISLYQSNPFYILAVKHIGKPQHLNFKLNFEEDNVKYMIYPKKIEAISKDRAQLKRVFNNFISVSSIGNFVEDA